MCTSFKLRKIPILEVGSTPKFDLDREFDMANKKYFNSELEKIPMKYGTISGRFGLIRAKVKYGRNKRIIEAYPEYLAISNRYDFTEEQFLATFLHELCHLYMIQDPTKYSWKGGYHGFEWRRLADEVSRKSGIEITEVGDANNVDTRDERNSYVAIFGKKPSSDFTTVAFTSTNIWDKKADEWIDMYLNLDSWYVKQGWKFVVVELSDGRLMNFARKSIKRPVLYKIDSDVSLDILKNKKYDRVLYTSGSE